MAILNVPVLESNKYLKTNFSEGDLSRQIHKIPPYLVKCFSFKDQGFFNYISQMNEPRGWTFLCL